MSNTEERSKHRSTNISYVVMAKVNAGEFIQLGKSALGNSLDLIVGNIEQLDTLLVLHRNLGHVGQKVERCVKMECVAQLVKSIFINFPDHVMGDVYD